MSKSDMSYGALLSLILGYKLYQPKKFKIDIIESLFEATLDKIIRITDNQDSLLLISAKYITELTLNRKYEHKIKQLIRRNLS